MKEEFYFTQVTAVQNSCDLLSAAQFAFDGKDYSDRPDILDEGILYRVTIEKVGIVRTTKMVEVEFDSAEQENSD